MLWVFGDVLWLVVDVMNCYDVEGVVDVVKVLVLLGLWWFEDICDFYDFFI